MTLKAVIIGTGGVANTHMQGYLDNSDKVEVVAVCDIIPERAKSFSEHYKIPRWYGSATKMLKDNSADLASVCTPNASHKALTLQALDAGCHVICEKPIGMNAREAAKMAAAAKSARRLLTIGHHLRFKSEHLALKKMVEEGVLGDIYYAHVQGIRRRGIPTWGVFHIKKHSGGGALIDIGVHFLDLVLWLMGSPEPVRVSAQTYDKLVKREDLVNLWGPVNRKEFDTDEFVSGYVRCKKGVTLCLEVSWAANTRDNMSHKIFGTKGGATLAPLTVFTQLSGSLVDITPTGLPQTAHSHAPLIRNMVEAITDGAEIVVKPQQSVQVMRIIDAIYRSAKLGREVKVAEL